MEFSKRMKRTSKLAVNVSRRIDVDFGGGQVTWEYRFASDDEPLPTAAKETGDGWILVSSSIRRDNSREFLLKRARR
jgi:hypothetical protein